MRTLGKSAPASVSISRTEPWSALMMRPPAWPGMSVSALVEQALRLRPRLKVLYTSGYTEDAIVQHGRLEPGVQLLPKPYRRDELAAKVTQALAGPPRGA